MVEYGASAFSAGEVSKYDAIAFGCPAMGAKSWKKEEIPAHVG